jgi:hypothetical protein
MSIFTQILAPNADAVSQHPDKIRITTRGGNNPLEGSYHRQWKLVQYFKFLPGIANKEYRVICFFQGFIQCVQLICQVSEGVIGYTSRQLGGIISSKYQAIGRCFGLREILHARLSDGFTKQVIPLVKIIFIGLD